MDCPVDRYRCKLKNSRQSVNFIVTRTYECPNCLTTFKTQEKIMFESIPSHIRNKFLNTGRMDK